jgi:hypothetical protein
MADQGIANQPASNNRVGFCDVPLVEAVEGAFAQLMALFAAWRAEIDAEPFAYSDEELLRAWTPRRDIDPAPVPKPSFPVDGPVAPGPSWPYWS